jgi:hypothetical protein
MLAVLPGALTLGMQLLFAALGGLTQGFQFLVDVADGVIAVGDDVPAPALEPARQEDALPCDDEPEVPPLRDYGFDFGEAGTARNTQDVIRIAHD